MKRILLYTVFLLSLNTLFAQPGINASKLQYTNALYFQLLGRAVPVSAPGDTSARVSGMDYARLPLDRRPFYRPALWDLGMNSAGLAIRFRSNSPAIGIRWKPLGNNSMNHMAATGVRGVDVYILHEGSWQYCGTGIPGNQEENQSLIMANMENTDKEFLVNLPLYDGLISLEIGVVEGSRLEKPQVDLPKVGKPLVFYGTSITQGGCATRPGMAYPAIISRTLQQETINLGFSGNGKMDASMGELLARIDAGAYFIDCLPNCNADLVRARGYDFLRDLINKKPDVPLFMVAYKREARSLYDTVQRQNIQIINTLWEGIYHRLKEEGAKVYYIPNLDHTAEDGDNTVDGVHLTDLGFTRLANQMVQAYQQVTLQQGKEPLLP